MVQVIHSCYCAALFVSPLLALWNICQASLWPLWSQSQVSTGWIHRITISCPKRNPLSSLNKQAKTSVFLSICKYLKQQNIEQNRSAVSLPIRLSCICVSYALTLKVPLSSPSSSHEIYSVNLSFKQCNQLTMTVMTAYNNTTNNHNWKNMIFPWLL